MAAPDHLSGSQADPPESGISVKEHIALLAVLDRAAEPLPPDLVAALRELPREAALPDAQDIWAVINTVHGWRRQRWAAKEILGPLLVDVPHVLKAIQMRAPLEGRVPHCPEWYFELEHAGGQNPEEGLTNCILRHRTSEELIVIALVEEEVGIEDLLPPSVECLESLKRRQSEEELHRRRNWPGHADWLARSLHSLGVSEWGATTPSETRANLLALAQQLHKRLAAVHSFRDRWDDPAQRVWQAALIGDWGSAQAAALTLGAPELIAVTTDRAEQLYCQRESHWLEELVYPEIFPPRLKVRVLADHGVKYIHDLLQQSLDAEAPEIPLALMLILAEDLPGWEQQVYPFFREGIPNNDIVWLAKCARYLCQREYKTEEVMNTLARWVSNGNCNWELYAALVATKYRPELGEVVFVRGIESDTEEKCIAALAALAAFKWPWALPLLKREVVKLASPLARACCRLALDGCEDSEQTTCAREDGKQVGQRRVIGVGQAFGWSPRRYLGTVEEFFADQIEQARALFSKA